MAIVGALIQMPFVSLFENTFRNKTKLLILDEQLTFTTKTFGYNQQES